MRVRFSNLCRWCGSSFRARCPKLIALVRTQSTDLLRISPRRISTRGRSDSTFNLGLSRAQQTRRSSSQDLGSQVRCRRSRPRAPSTSSGHWASARAPCPPLGLRGEGARNLMQDAMPPSSGGSPTPSQRRAAYSTSRRWVHQHLGLPRPPSRGFCSPPPPVGRHLA